MKLLKIIRTKFFPPNNTENIFTFLKGERRDYFLEEMSSLDGRKFRPYVLKGSRNSKFTPNNYRDGFDTNENDKWFDTPEVARECAWNQYNEFHATNVCDKEPG